MTEVFKAAIYVTFDSFGYSGAEEYAEKIAKRMRNFKGVKTCEVDEIDLEEDF